MKKTMFFGFLFLIHAGAARADASLQLAVDNREVAVGETLKVRVIFQEKGTGGSVVLREPALPTPRLFVIRGIGTQSNIAMVNQQVVSVITTEFTLLAKGPGEEDIGPAVLIYEDAQGRRREIQSSSTRVRVVEKGKRKAPPAVPSTIPSPSPPAAGDLRDIKLLLEPPRTWWSFFAALAAAVAAFFVVLKFFGKRKQNVPRSSGIESWRLAWKALSRGGEELATDAFALSFARLVREGLSLLLAESMLEKTTEEIQKRLEAQKKIDRVLWTAWLEKSDRVLFAGEPWPVPERRETLSTLKREMESYKIK